MEIATRTFLIVDLLDICEDYMILWHNMHLRSVCKGVGVAPAHGLVILSFNLPVRMGRCINCGPSEHNWRKTEEIKHHSGTQLVSF